MNIDYFAVVVVYNQSVDDSDTCKLLREIKNYNITVVIVDNSIRENNNKVLCEKYGWVYLTKGGNVGLSKGYNMALDYLADKVEDGCVIWFDDDSHITQGYFDELNCILINTDAEIIAPVIIAQNGKIYSPNESRFFKNKQLRKSSDSLNLKRFNAINSCTAVRLSVFQNYRYDERIFLDQVDHNFFRDQRSQDRRFYKMKAIINHNFSLKSKMPSMDAVKNRYSVMIPDFFVYCSKSKTTLLLGKIKVFGWGIRESYKYRDWSFLTWCLQEAKKTIKEKGL